MAVLVTAIHAVQRRLYPTIDPLLMTGITTIGRIPRKIAHNGVDDRDKPGHDGWMSQLRNHFRRTKQPQIAAGHDEKP
jgi:hypothetical protein